MKPINLPVTSFPISKKRKGIEQTIYIRQKRRIYFLFILVFVFLKTTINKTIKTKKKIGNEYLNDEKLIILITKSHAIIGKSLKYDIFSFLIEINTKKINTKKKYGDVKKNALYPNKPGRNKINGRSSTRNNIVLIDKVIFKIIIFLLNQKL